MEYHEKRLDAVYLNLKGWFSKKELDLVMDTIDEALPTLSVGKKNKSEMILSKD